MGQTQPYDHGLYEFNFKRGYVQYTGPFLLGTVSNAALVSGTVSQHLP
jgi:hypothetical protein